jgi:uncharacterized protein YueI
MNALKYLLEFDVKSEVPEIEILEDLDIEDKTILQKQINQSRKSYRQLIELYDSLQEDKSKILSKLSFKKQNFYINFANRNDRSEAIAKDKEMSELEETVNALSDAMQTVKNYIDYVKSDLKILNGSMYNKF